VPIKISGDKVEIASTYTCRTHEDYAIYLKIGEVFPECPVCKKINIWFISEKLTIKQSPKNTKQMNDIEV
jgi:hypothetical protein